MSKWMAKQSVGAEVITDPFDPTQRWLVDTVRRQAQPMRRQRLHGFEALVRWQHPRDGSISPAAFLPIAEEAGLMIKLTDFMLHGACRQLRTWQLRGGDWLATAPSLMGRGALRDLAQAAGLVFVPEEFGVRAGAQVEDGVVHVHGLDVAQEPHLLGVLRGGGVILKVAAARRAAGPAREVCQ